MTCARTQPASEWERFWGENVWPTPILPVSSCWSFSGVSKYFSTRIIPLQLVSGVWFGVVFLNLLFCCVREETFQRVSFSFSTWIVLLCHICCFSFQFRSMAACRSQRNGSKRWASDLGAIARAHEVNDRTIFAHSEHSGWYRWLSFWCSSFSFTLRGLVGVVELRKATGEFSFLPEFAFVLVHFRYGDTGRECGTWVRGKIERCGKLAKKKYRICGWVKW